MEGCDHKGWHEGFLEDDGTPLCLDFAGDYTILCMSQKLQKCTPKKIYFIINKFNNNSIKEKTW